MSPKARLFRFPAGLFVAGLAVLLYKAVSLSLEVSGSAWLAWRFMAPDLDMLGLLLAGGLVTAAAHGLARLVLKGLLFLSTVYFAVHSVVLLELDESMSLFDLARYLPEWGVVQSFLGVGSLLSIVLLLASLMVDLRIGRRGFVAACAAALALFLLGLVATSRAPADLRRYSMLQLGRVAAAWSRTQPAASYTPAQRDFFASAAAPPASIPDRRRNIVLLIVESLSSINSRRTSGVFDLMPQFDRLSEQGQLFPNFFANHAASEGGIISLMSGFPPVHFPTASPLMFDEFAMQPAVIQDYQAAGYVTEFLTNTDLSFIGLNRYLKGLGLDLVRGRDEVPAFADAERHVQDAPSDRLLYGEALRRIEARIASQTPFLMVVATASTHLPYTHPEGGEDSPQAVWDWALERLAEFHSGLEKLGFYADGILLITGDHRQMRPVSQAETRRYGDSARARVPLLAIGTGIEAGGIDARWFQQADLLRQLPALWAPGQVPSPNPIWVERYNRIYGKVDSINRLGVFDRSNDGRTLFPLRIFGADLSWPGARPEAYRDIEAALHAQRSAHQFVRHGSGPGCAGLDQVAADDTAPALWSVRGTLDVPEAGTYWFRPAHGGSLCLAIDGRWLIDQQAGAPQMQAPVQLEAGRHELVLRFEPQAGAGLPGLEWVTPGNLRWRWRDVPAAAIRLEHDAITGVADD